MRDLRIHHFFDIIRDYGDHRTLRKHEYGHSYHVIGKEIYNNELDSFKIIVGNDDICEGCCYLESGRCLDSIGHRSDFKSKEAFNNYLDRRIMTVMGYREDQIIKVRTVIEDAGVYLDSIFDIYTGNDPGHTEKRKSYVASGVSMKRRELVIEPEDFL